jgi:hypothetical protein
MAVQGVTEQFWEAAFVYNFVYSSADFLSRLKSIAAGMFYLSTLTLLALTGWGACFLGLKLKKLHLRQTLDPVAVSLLSIGLIDLPIEVIMASISGYSYRHYYISLIPIYAVFAGFGFWLLLTQLSYPSISRKIKELLTICIAVIFLIPVVGAGIALVKDTHYISDRGIAYNDVISYVKLHTSEDDTVLLWGAEAEINYSAQRRSPSRFIYQDPLYKVGYTDEKIVAEFLSEVVKNKPRFIIDTKYSRTPIYDFGITSPEISNDLQFLQSNYKVVEKFGPWVVYEYEGN